MPKFFWNPLNLIFSFLGTTVFLFTIFVLQPQPPKRYTSPFGYGTQPLVMEGGDPYLRALMRTITASEANAFQPYTILYGGRHFDDLTRHPERCVPIGVGPNKGNCTTAAGRYQFLNVTWYEKAKRYHPEPSDFLGWRNYSFEPQYQDAVIYAWLKDRKAWRADIPKLLHDGKIREVLRLLSGTWTSLGYGIETNSMSDKLPKIYEKLLEEELSKWQQELATGNLPKP